MTELGKVFLQEAAVGAAVTVTLAAGKEKTGAIRSISGGIVRLQSPTGVFAFSADSLLCYELLSELPKAEAQAAPSAVKAALTPAEAAAQEVEREGSAAFFQKPEPVDLAQWQQRIRQCGAGAADAGKALEQLKNAIRLNELDAKFGRTDKVAMGLRVVMEERADCAFLGELLGAVYELGGKDERAADAYFQAACFEKSYQAALRARDEARQREALLGLLCDGEEKGARVSRFFVLCGRTKRPDEAAELCERLQGSASEALCALLCKGMIYLLWKENALPPLQEPPVREENFPALLEAVRALPAEKPQAAEVPEQAEQVEEPGLDAAPEGYETGVITALKGGFGFIGDDVFFGFHAVADDALREEVWDGVGVGTPVCYHASTNEKGKTAIDIYRLKRQKKSAPAPAEPQGEAALPEGYETGVITALKGGYGFIGDDVFFGFHAVADETLRNEVWNGDGVGTPVSYRASTNEKGKTAVDVRRLLTGRQDGAPKAPGLTAVPEGYLTGRITSTRNGFGFIDGTVFFGFHAVADEELRNRLREGKPVLCPVCYQIGQNERGACAVNVWRLAVEPEKAEKGEPGLSEQAQRALEGGDEEKALELFEQARVKGFLTDGAVADLAMLYSRRGEHRAAETLLNSYAGKLSEEKRLNLLITIYDKAGRYEELIGVLDKAIAAAAKPNTKLHYLMRKGNVLSGALNRPAEALRVYETFLETRRENARLLGLPENESESASGTVGAVKRSVALCHYRLSRAPQAEPQEPETEEAAARRAEHRREAERLAEELLRANPDDECSRGILDGTLDPMVRPGDLFLLSREGDAPEVGALSAFLTNRLNGCELKNYIDIRRVNLLNDTFKGTVRQAEVTVRGLLAKLSSQKPKARSESLLAAAKIVSQFAGESSDGFASVRNFRNLLGRSLVSSGDNLLASMTAQPDVVRFYYRESLRFLSSSEQDRQNALVRYLSSFFRELRDVPLEITGGRNLSLSQDFEALLEQEEPDADALAGAIVDLISASAEELQELCALLARHGELARRTAQSLSRRLGREVEPAGTERELAALFAAALIKRQRDLEAFSAAVRLLGGYSFNQRWLDEYGASLSRCALYPELCTLERERIDQLGELFAQSRKYVDSADFEIRESALKSILWQCEEQQGRILEAPTELAFEQLLPLFVRCAAVAGEELKGLYQNNRPELEMSLVNGNLALAAGSDTIDVQINLKNAPGMQAADNLRFSLPDQSKYALAAPVELRKRYIKGGESNTYILRLALGEELAGAKAFSLLVAAEGEYRSDGGTESFRLEKSFSINLSDAESFQPIANPYAPYIESGVVANYRMFYGREKEINEIFQMLFSEDDTPLRSKSIILYGQKRTGKSSLLYHLGKRIETRKHAILVNMGDISSMADLSGGASKLLMDEKFFQAFCYILFDNLQNELYARHPELIARMAEAELTIPLEEMLDPAANHTLLFHRFFTRFNRLLDSGENAGKYSVILLIDEFTYVYSWIQQGVLSVDFMKFWKGVIQDLGLVGILVGQDYMPDFIAAVPNAFGSTEKHRVTYLTEENALRLIEEPIMMIDPETFSMESRYKEGATSRILELTAGSAYYTMILCDRLVRYLNEKASNYVTDADVNELLYTNMLSGVNMLKKDYFDPLYNDEGCFDDTARSEDNLVLLRAIAQCCGRENRCLISAVRCPSLTEERQAMLLKQLEKRDVVEITEDRYCRIKVGLFREWLLV